MLNRFLYFRPAQSYSLADIRWECPVMRWSQQHFPYLFDHEASLLLSSEFWDQCFTKHIKRRSTNFLIMIKTLLQMDRKIPVRRVHIPSILQRRSMTGRSEAPTHNTGARLIWLGRHSGGDAVETHWHFCRGKAFIWETHLNSTGNFHHAVAPDNNMFHSYLWSFLCELPPSYLHECNV